MATSVIIDFVLIGSKWEDRRSMVTSAKPISTVTALVDVAFADVDRIVVPSHPQPDTADNRVSMAARITPVTGAIRAAFGANMPADLALTAGIFIGQGKTELVAVSPGDLIAFSEVTVP